MSVGTLIISGLGSDVPIGTEAVYLKKAYDVLGLDSLRLGHIFTHFDLYNGFGWVAVAGGGTIEFDGARAAGVMTLATSGGASNFSGLVREDSPVANDYATIFPADNTGKWYLAGRMSLTRMDGTSFCELGCSNGTTLSRKISIGTTSSHGNLMGMVLGPGGAAVMDSGIAFDNSMHTYEFWHAGTGTLSLRIDDGAITTLAAGSTTFPDVVTSPYLYVSNGTDGNARTQAADWALWAFDRAA